MTNKGIRQHHGVEEPIIMFVLIGMIAFALILYNTKKAMGNISYRMSIGMPKTLLGSVAKSVYKKRLLVWEAAAGEYAAATYGLSTMRVVTHCVIKTGNTIKPLWVPSSIMTVIGAIAVFLLTRRSFHVMSWSSWHRITFIAVGMVWVFTVISAPLVHPWVSFGFILMGLASTATALVNIYMTPRPPKNRILNYGPNILPPKSKNGETASKGDGVCVGKVENGVLPDNTRWIGGHEGVSIVLPADKLSCGVTILGDMGSGKTRLMMLLHDYIRAQYPNIPILIHDPKGEWFRTYYDPKTDVYFAPHFAGSAAWSLWNDLKSHPELQHEVISTAVNAHASTGDSFWMDNAANLLRMAFGQDTLQSARDFMVAMKEKNSDDKMFASVFGTTKLGLMDIVKVELDAQRKANNPGPKSIDDYLKWPGRIFLLNSPSCAAEQKGAFSLFLSMFLLRGLSMADVAAPKLRLSAFIDEALTFTLPEDVERRIYTQCRSKGMSLVAGAQRLPERHRKEGGEWRTAEFMFGMKVFNQETQESLSKRAGDLQYELKTKSKTQAQSGMGVSQTESQQQQRHRAIPSEHFGRLPTREFILFHENGITPGKTGDINVQQRDIEYPAYDERREVLEFAQTLE